MADAQLDLEIQLDGAETTADGLNKVAAAEVGVTKNTIATASTTSVLSSAVSGLSRGAIAATAAQNAFSQVMAGNFVGAARSAATAIKALWGALAGNPFTIVMAAVAAAGLALVSFIKYQKDAAQSAKDHAKEMAGLRDELNLLKFGSVSDNVAENIENMKASGDVGGLVKSKQARKDANAKLEADAQTLYAAIDSLKVGGFGKDDEQRQKDEMIQQYRDLLDQINENRASINAYTEAIRELDAADDEMTAGAIDNLSSIEEKQREAADKALADTIEASAAELEAGNKAAQKQLDDAKENADKLKAIKKELADYELEQAQRVADESRAIADKALAAEEAARQNILNPGQAGDPEREAAREKRRDELRMKARMSGNSVEAGQRRDAYGDAQMAAWFADQDAGVKQSKIDVAKSERDAAEHQAIIASAAALQTIAAQTA